MRILMVEAGEVGYHAAERRLPGTRHRPSIDVALTPVHGENG